MGFHRRSLLMLALVASLFGMARTANAQSCDPNEGYACTCLPLGSAPQAGCWYQTCHLNWNQLTKIPTRPSPQLVAQYALQAFHAKNINVTQADLIKAVAYAYQESNGFVSNIISPNGQVGKDPDPGLCTQDFGLWQINSAYTPAPGACAGSYDGGFGGLADLNPAQNAADFVCQLTNNGSLPEPNWNWTSWLKRQRPLQGSTDVATLAIVQSITVAPPNISFDMANPQVPITLTATAVAIDGSDVTLPNGFEWNPLDPTVALVTQGQVSPVGSSQYPPVACQDIFADGTPAPTIVGLGSTCITAFADTSALGSTAYKLGLNQALAQALGSAAVTVTCNGCSPNNPPPSRPGGNYVWDPNANGGKGGWIWVPNYGNLFGPISTLYFLYGGVLDPNDKAGSTGVGTPQYVSGRAPLRYAVYFSNEVAATLPVQKIVVTDQLDATNDNLSSFQLGPIAFNGNLLTPPAGLTSFATTVDLRPASNLGVAVNEALNTSTGLLTLSLQSLDPTTSQPPADPTAGFLPPGGLGSMFFTVMPNSGLSTNTQIQNQASIVFDANPSMSTTNWLNTIDNTPPTSHVSALPATENLATFTLQWSGTDVGAGIQDYTVYASDNGAAYSAFQTNTTATSAAFTGQSGHTYAFYSVSRDLVGNVEGKSPVAEATTSVPTNLAPAFTSIATVTFQVGVAGLSTVVTTGFPVPSIVEIGSLPSGLTFVDNGNGTATLSGTPAPGLGGTYNISLAAQNGITPNASESFTLVVDQVPAIASAAVAAFQTGTASSFTVTTTGFPAVAITESGALPAGVTFVDDGNGTATLAGTPTAGGVFSLTITAANGVMPNATQSFTLTVNQPPAFTSLNSATFLVGTAGSFAVATSGFPRASFTEAGGLPAGVAFVDNGNGTATLAGTPTASGIYSITLNANSTSGVAAQTFTLTVDQPPTITSSAATVFQAGTASSFTINTSGFPTAVITESGSLPNGVTFTNNGNGTATLAGTPTVGGAFNLAITAANAASPNATQSFNLTVNQTPTFTSANNATLLAGTPGSFAVTTNGFPTASLTESGGLPAGVTFVNNGNATATLAGTPTANGIYGITLNASSTSGAAAQSFTLTVNQAPSISSASSATLLAGKASSFSVTSIGFPLPTLTQTGTLPAGLIFTNNGNGTGTVAGTPSASGIFNLNFAATNTVGVTQQGFTLTVDQTPSFNSGSAATFQSGSANSFTVATAGFPTTTLVRAVRSLRA
jgi:hypothetical protein